MKYVNYGVVFQEIPGETTLAINISNCPVRCPGCHSQYLWGDVGEELDICSLDDLIGKYKQDITCVCFMGGDADPETINLFAQHIKQHHQPLKVGWYSGYDSPSIWTNAVNFDYIKLGPYIRQRGGLKSPATNQRLYLIEKGYWKDITGIFWKK